MRKVVAFLILVTTWHGVSYSCPEFWLKKDGWQDLLVSDLHNHWRGFYDDTIPATWLLHRAQLINLGRTHKQSLLSKKKYENFVLYFAWKAFTRTNSGIKYMVRENTDQVGLEYQIHDDEHLENGPSFNKHRTAALYDILPNLSRDQLAVAGVLNRGCIVVMGAHVEHWLNEVRVLHYTIGSPAFLSGLKDSKYYRQVWLAKKQSGYLLIQDHKSPIVFEWIKLLPLL